MSRSPKADRIVTRLAAAVDRHRAGALDEADKLYRRVLDDDPRQVDALHLLGMLHFQRGRRDAGLSSVRRALQLRPLFPEAWVTLGNGLREVDDAEGAGVAFRCAIATQPSMIEAVGNLAQMPAIGAAMGRVWLDRGVSIAPTNVGILANLAIGALAAGEWDKADRALRRALALHPAFVTTLALAGAVRRRRGSADAAGWFARAAILAPDDPEHATNLGAVWLESGERDRAERWLSGVLGRWPLHAAALVAQGIALRRRGALDDALRLLRQAVVLTPASPTGLRDLATIMLDIGVPRVALALTHRSIAADPTDLQAGRNLMSASLYDPEVDRKARWNIHRKVTAGFPRRETPAWPNNRNEARPIRVAYVSSDLREHPLGRYIASIMAAHDRRLIETYGYSLSPVEDGLTATLRRKAAGWRQVAAMEDSRIAERMLDDGIDVAVFLGLHFDGNRPTLPALRCAPIQISSCDVSSMAMEEIDYLVSDRTMSPVTGGERLQERVLALPHFYVHAPLDTGAGSIATERRGGMTVSFGAFNLPSKMNDAVLALWARVLAAVPNSSLSFRHRNFFENRVARDRIDAIMHRHGVDASRLVYFPGAASAEEYYSSLGGIDVMLDPFPFNGHTATFESLWMGVPVVTLAGDTQAGRHAAAQLRAIGLTELVAATADEYVATAAALATDPDRLVGIRRRLREDLRNSPLCDPVRLTRNLERFYRAVWRRWCAGLPAARLQQKP
ncbi:MAG: tetratricopeptide repeat protein [Rhodospirillaceae bacterium]|nr:tetratricopeptide repeat protein [Rhodospirillaceae bacterium]